MPILQALVGMRVIDQPAEQAARMQAVSGLGVIGTGHVYYDDYRVRHAAAAHATLCLGQSPVSIDSRTPVVVMSGLPGMGKSRALLEAIIAAEETAHERGKKALLLPITFNHYTPVTTYSITDEAALSEVSIDMPVVARLLFSQFKHSRTHDWAAFRNDLMKAIPHVPELGQLTVRCVVRALLAHHRCDHAVVGMDAWTRCSCWRTRVRST